MKARGMLPTSPGEGGPKLIADLSGYTSYSRSDDMLLNVKVSLAPRHACLIQ
jgi:hypothetical protein